MTESQIARLVSHWILTDRFDKLEEFENDNGCITLFLDDMWDVFFYDTKMSALLEEAYNKWTS